MGKRDQNPINVCLNCGEIYDGDLHTCPYCGFTEVGKQRKQSSGWTPVIIIISIIIALITGGVIFVISAKNRAQRLYEESPIYAIIEESKEKLDRMSQEMEDRRAYLNGEIETYTTYERTMEEKQSAYDFYMEKLEPLLKIKEPDITERAQIMALIDLINDLGLPGVHMEYPDTVAGH